MCVCVCVCVGEAVQTEPEDTVCKGADRGPDEAQIWPRAGPDAVDFWVGEDILSQGHPTAVNKTLREAHKMAATGSSSISINYSTSDRTSVRLRSEAKGQALNRRHRWIRKHSQHSVSQRSIFTRANKQINTP